MLSNYVKLFTTYHTFWHERCSNHHLCNLLEELNIDIVKNRKFSSKHIVRDYISILMKLLD